MGLGTHSRARGLALRNARRDRSLVGKGDAEVPLLFRLFGLPRMPVGEPFGGRHGVRTAWGDDLALGQIVWRYSLVPGSIFFMLTCSLSMIPVPFSTDSVSFSIDWVTIERLFFPAVCSGVAFSAPTSLIESPSKI